MSSTSELEVQTEILDWLNKEPDLFAWRYSSTGVWDAQQKKFRKKAGFDIKGVSDVLGLRFPSGVMFAIEVKKPHSTLSAVSMEQRAFITKIRKMGGYATWVTSLGEAKEFIREFRLATDREGS